MNGPRFQVHDEDGPVRAFWTRADALAWMNLRAGLRLVVRPRPPKVEIPFEPALF